MKLLIILLSFLYLLNQTNSYSISKFNYKLFTDNCFNNSKITGNLLKLGQDEPIGLSIENLISLIERFEILNPQYSPKEVIKIFLKRLENK